MKKLFYLIIILSLFAYCSSQKTDWKGTIEEGDGVTAGFCATFTIVVASTKST